MIVQAPNSHNLLVSTPNKMAKTHSFVSEYELRRYLIFTIIVVIAAMPANHSWSGAQVLAKVGCSRQGRREWLQRIRRWLREIKERQKGWRNLLQNSLLFAPFIILLLNDSILNTLFQNSIFCQKKSTKKIYILDNNWTFGKVKYCKENWNKDRLFLKSLPCL